MTEIVSHLSILTRIPLTRSGQKTDATTSDEDTASLGDEPVAIITFTNYSRPDSYPHALRRYSSHAVLSTQTLGHIYDAIPCRHKNMPHEYTDDNGLLQYETYDPSDAPPRGYVICIEETLHGDGLSNPDYAE